MKTAPPKNREEMIRDGLTGVEGEILKWRLNHGWGVIRTLQPYSIHYYSKANKFPLAQRNRLGPGLMVRFSADPQPHLEAGKMPEISRRN